MKYITVKQGNCEYPILFPDEISHSQVARIHCVGGRESAIVMGAGFCHIHMHSKSNGDVAELKATVWGKSDSLADVERLEHGKDHAEKHTKLIREHFSKDIGLVTQC